MPRLRRLRALVLLAISTVALRAAAAAEPVPVTRTVDGVAREGLQVIPTESSPAGAPVVLVFHGHGGTARHAARTFALHRHWPEAIVVYPQGLNTPGRRTDPEGRRPGWQHAAGEQREFRRCENDPGCEFTWSESTQRLLAGRVKLSRDGRRRALGNF